MKERLERITDPRRQWGNLRHKLEDILVIALATLLCDGEDFQDMETLSPVNWKRAWTRGCTTRYLPKPDSLFLSLCGLCMPGSIRNIILIKNPVMFFGKDAHRLLFLAN
jgi:hypothetical protein